MDWENDVDFILGYLNQCMKMNHIPKRILDIMLFLTTEIKKIKDDKKK
jgi:hypothetical protein